MVLLPIRGDVAIFSFLVGVVSASGVLLSAFYIFAKSINHKPTAKHTALCALWCSGIALLFALGLPWITPLMGRLFICAASIVFIWLLAKIKLDTVVSAFLFAFGVSYVLSLVLAFVVGIIFMPLVSGEHIVGAAIDHNAPFNLFFYALVSVLQLVLSFLIFRIRRFKRGLPFIRERYAIIAALIVAGTVMIIATRGEAIVETETAFAAYLYLAGIFIIGFGIYIWIRRGIKMFLLKRTKERNEEILRQENDELKRENRQLKHNQETMRAANHSINHRLKSAERSVAALLEKARGHEVLAELSEELAVELDNIRRLEKDYQGDLKREMVDIALTSTNVKAIDNLFELFAERFADNEIDFKLKITGSVVYMTENIISQGKLEVMIGDHLQDALIAVNAKGGDTRRCVLAILGEAEGFYELSIHDTGIPFEMDTLIRLGTERVTTHADTGGSGVGFMKTFETMRECGASLIIKENEPGGAFAKSVTIRFDEKNEYVIQTYRADEFPKDGKYLLMRQ